MSMSRIVPGVYSTVIDKTLGLQIQGLGGIGQAAVLEKGPIGEGIVVNGRADLMRLGGMPIPNYNLLSWHFIDNIFNYTGNVIVSRVARLDNDVTATMLKLTDANAQAYAFTDGTHNDIDPVHEMKKVLKLATVLSITNTISTANIDAWNKAELRKNDDEFLDVSFPVSNPESKMGLVDYTANTFGKGDVFCLTTAADRYYQITDEITDNVYSYIIGTTSNPYVSGTDFPVGSDVLSASISFGKMLAVGTVTIGGNPFTYVKVLVTDSDELPAAVSTITMYNVTNSNYIPATLTAAALVGTANPTLPQSFFHFIGFAMRDDGSYNATVSMGPVTVAYEDAYGVLQTLATTVSLSNLNSTSYDSFDWNRESTAGTISSANCVKPVFKFFAPTAGAWYTNEAIKVAVCSMRQTSDTANDFDNTLVDSLGSAAFSSFFSYGPELNDLYNNDGLTNPKYLQSEVAILVYNADSVLEKYIVSMDNTSKDEAGNSRYIEDVINRKSEYIRVEFNTGVLTGTSKNYVFRQMVDIEMTGGMGATDIVRTTFVATSDATTYSMADVETALEVFVDPEDISISYLTENMWGGKTSTIYEHLETLAKNRGDCIAIIAPGVDIGGATVATIISDMATYSDTLGLTTGSEYGQWASFYPNCKMIYDNINDSYLWIPCSSDLVGMHSATDNGYEVWTPVAGLTRGVLRNSVKLAWSPTFNQRETLIKQRFCPIYNIKGTGPTCMDTSNLYNKKSDMAENFNRKTVNFLGKNIGKYLNQVLFEFNNEITRNRVLQTVTPFLVSVKNREGVIDYKVVCDTSNNTAAVIENNELVCDVYLKLQHVAKVISLNFIITKTSQSFTSNA